MIDIVVVGDENITSDDYTLSDSSVTIAADGTTGSVTLTANSDKISETKESLSLSLSLADDVDETNGVDYLLSDDSISVGIVDVNRMISISSSTTSFDVNEGEMQTITLTANESVSQDMRINISVVLGDDVDSSDYSVDEFVIIRDEQSSVDFTFNASSDRVKESRETLTLSLSLADSVDEVDGVDYLLSDDSISVGIVDVNREILISSSVSSFDVDEGSSQVITFTANESVSQETVIDIVVVGDENITSDDYTLSDSSVTIAADGTTGSVTLTANSDDVGEVRESLSLSLSLADDVDETNGVDYSLNTNSIGVNIDNVNKEITISPSLTDFDVTEGTSRDIMFTASEAVSQDTVINIVVTGGTGVVEEDYILNASSVTITAGQTTSDAVNFVARLDLNNSESRESLSLDLSLVDVVDEDNGVDYSFTDSSIDVGIINAPGEITISPQAIIFNVNEGSSQVITFTADHAVTQNTTINIAIDSGSASVNDYSLNTSTVTIDAGDTSASLKFTANIDGVVESTENLVLRYSLSDNYDNDANVNYYLNSPNFVVNIVNVNYDEISISPSTTSFDIDEGSSQTITLTANESVTQDTVINIGISGSDTNSGDYSVPSSVTITSGTATADFTFTANSDDIVEGKESLTLDLSLEDRFDHDNTKVFALGSSSISVGIVDLTPLPMPTGLTVPAEFIGDNIVSNTKTRYLRNNLHYLTMDSMTLPSGKFNAAEESLVSNAKTSFPGTDLLGSDNRVINYNEATNLASDVVLRLDLSEDIVSDNNLILLALYRNRNLGSGTISLHDIKIDSYDTVETENTGTPESSRIVTQDSVASHILVPQRERLIAHFVDDETRTVFITIYASSASARTDKFMQMNVLALETEEGLINGTVVTGDASKATT